MYKLTKRQLLIACCVCLISFGQANADAFLAQQEHTVAPPKISAISYSGGDGASFDTAIIINGAKREIEGVSSEYRWLRKKLPGAKTLRQAVVNQSNQVYDLFEVRLSDNTTRSVYFDITAFFGKL
jgi:hypothetical protein